MFLHIIKNIPTYHLTSRIINHNILVSQGSLIFSKTQSSSHFLTCFKTNFNPKINLCLSTPISPIIHQYIRFKCLGLIDILKLPCTGGRGRGGGQGRANKAHVRAPQSRKNTHDRATTAHGRATLSGEIFLIFHFTFLCVKFIFLIRFQFR